ncbi:hypothetical protein LMH87_004390 [Akanthomyces muscarius]|uniref:Uncharacterized protein n=1 Tax=Akanthomyces muscarius TaxID=2231603 RepID=A0A9W8UFK3_AKAMU|nr:hypothetical protein LMH87_004390 [Akanthomyces muscarius]KAJ4145542.1 hypothetical protein LMH87_004390 [Akanthomyces muscarius]
MAREGLLGGGQRLGWLRGTTEVTFDVPSEYKRGEAIQVRQEVPHMYLRHHKTKSEPAITTGAGAPRHDEAQRRGRGLRENVRWGEISLRKSRV